MRKTNLFVPMFRSLLNISTLFLAILCPFLCVTSQTQAATGDNCQLNITTDISEDANWSSIFLIQAKDGSFWKRGIISDKSNFILKEGEKIEIWGVAEPYAEVQIFLFTHSKNEDDETIQKPGSGNCFEIAQADQNGLFHITIHSRILWGAIGQSIVVDAFYQLENETDIPDMTTTNQNFFIGTHLQPTVTLVHTEDEEIPFCEHLCSNTQLIESVRLDPSQFPEKYIQNNFDNIYQKPVIIGRSPGYHTYYSSIENETDNFRAKDELQKIVFKSLIMESIKRLLMADTSTSRILRFAPGIYPFEPEKLQKASEENEEYSRNVRSLARDIKTILTGSGNIEEATNNIQMFINKIMNTNTVNILSVDNTSLLKELIPTGISDENSWAKDFFQLIQFWTGKNERNRCLMHDDSLMHLSFTKFPGVETNLCSYIYTNGITPAVLLRTQKEITIQPDFQNIKIVSAERPFDQRETWHFPSGIKQPFRYYYETNQTFSGNFSKEICLQKKDLPEFTQKIQQKFLLTDSEIQLLSEELSLKITDPKTYYSLQLADQKMITNRFQWITKKRKLKLLQLFFTISKNTCTHKKYPSFSEFSPPKKIDGIEVGFLPL
jgi:hypothetical protein